MSSIFPIRDTISRDEPREPRLVDLDEETADEVFQALSSQTTREIFLSLHEDPQTASDLAEQTDTSVQNVQYHLEKLTDVELVEVADTWYSERGSEMKVYAPADESLVLYAGRDKQTTFRSLLKRFTGVVSLLVPGSLLASWLVARSGSDSSGAAGTGGEQLEVVRESEVARDGNAPTAEGGDDVSALDSTNVTEEQIQTGGENVTEAEFLSATDADIVLSGNETGQSILIADGGNATTVPNGTVPATAETTAGVDPALAAGAAFLLGGLVVAVALLAYYGLPE